MAEQRAFDLKISVQPLAIESHRFMVVAARDTSDERRREVLERIFFHDVLNTATVIKGIHDVWPLLRPDETDELRERARAAAGQLVEEIRMQRDVTMAERGNIEVRPVPVRSERQLRQVTRLLGAPEPGLTLEGAGQAWAKALAGRAS